MPVFRGPKPQDAPAPAPAAKKPLGPSHTERIQQIRNEQKKDRRRVWMALISAAIASNVAGAAIFLTMRAQHHAAPVSAGTPSPGCDTAADVCVPAGHQPDGPLPASPPASLPSSSPYAVAYAQEPLRVQVGCSAVVYVDLDEPRSDAQPAAGDLRYDSRCGDQAPGIALGPGAAAGAQVPDSNIDAAGCYQAVRNSPLGPGASVDVRKGVVLCVLTAAEPPRMVLVEITDVGRTGLAGMRATSWKVAG